MSDITTCPQCERKLRVPAEMVGQPVKCPSCSATFTARVGGQPSAPPTPSDPYSEQYPTSGQGWSDQREQYGTPASPYDRPDFGTRKKSTPGTLLAPAIFLIIVGCLGMIADTYQAIKAIAGTPDLRPNPGIPAEWQPFFIEMEKASHGPMAFALGLTQLPQLGG